MTATFKNTYTAEITLGDGSVVKVKDGPGIKSELDFIRDGVTHDFIHFQDSEAPEKDHYLSIHQAMHIVFVPVKGEQYVRPKGDPLFCPDQPKPPTPEPQTSRGLSEKNEKPSKTR